ncbi:hypothetical protein MMC07_003731 [Pseudocyphellaria aurata]|nr:hypothetical protein [Pseudocyphellaria aurata]
MATGRDQAENTLEYQAEQWDPFTNHPGKQVAIDYGKQCIEDKGGLEVAPNEDSANVDFNDHFDRHQTVVHGVPGQRLSARRRKLFCGLAGLTIILGAILGGVLGARHKTSATASITPTQHNTTASVTPTQHNIAAVSYTSKSVNFTRVYFQDNVGQIIEASTSGENLAWSINKTGFGGKNGSVIAVAVSPPNSSLEISIYYLDVNNLIHDISCTASTANCTSGTLSAQGYTAMPNSSLSATYDWCSVCANNTIIVFQDEGGSVQIGNFTPDGWTLQQLGQSLEPEMGTGLALVHSHYGSFNHGINLYYQKSALNMALAHWDGNAWSPNSAIYGTIPPGAHIAAATSYSNVSTGFETWIKILSLDTTGIKVSTWSGTELKFLAEDVYPATMANSTTNKRIYESVAVTAIGNAFAVVKQDGQADAIENWQLADDTVGWGLVGNRLQRFFPVDSLNLRPLLLAPGPILSDVMVKAQVTAKIPPNPAPSTQTVSRSEVAPPPRKDLKRARVVARPPGDALLVLPLPKGNDHKRRASPESLALERAKDTPRVAAYSGENQQALDEFIRSVEVVFRVKPTIYARDIDKCLFAGEKLAGRVKTEWATMDDEIRTSSSKEYPWIAFKVMLQDEVLPQAQRELNLARKINVAQQRKNQSVGEFFSHLQSLTRQLPADPPEFIYRQWLLVKVHAYLIEHLQMNQRLTHGTTSSSPLSCSPGTETGSDRTEIGGTPYNSAHQVLQLRQVGAHDERLPRSQESTTAAVGKSGGQVMVASLIQARKARQAPPHHLFRPIQLYDGYHSLTVEAEIDCGSSYNLISQILVRELDLQGDGNLPSGLKTIDGSPLRVYDNYVMTVHLQGEQGSSSLQQDLLGVDLVDKSCQVILGMAWLTAANPQINWAASQIRFPHGHRFATPEGVTGGEDIMSTQEPPREESATVPIRGKKPAVLVSQKNSKARATTNTPHPDISLVTKSEILHIAKTEKVEPWLVQWRDEDMGEEDVWNDSGRMVAAIIQGEDIIFMASQAAAPSSTPGDITRSTTVKWNDSDTEQIINWLSERDKEGACSNLNDWNKGNKQHAAKDKDKANLFHDHSQHSLAIDLVEGKQPLFGSVYDPCEGCAREYFPNNNGSYRATFEVEPAPTGMAVMETAIDRGDAAVKKTSFTKSTSTLAFQLRTILTVFES